MTLWLTFSSPDQIARVSYYQCVASLQYLAPLLLCLFLVLVHKSTGQYRWIPGALQPNSTTLLPTLSSQSQSIPINETETNRTILSDPLNLTAAVGQQEIEDTAKLALTLLRDVFNPIVLRALTGFLLWWSCTVWFSTSVVGFVYHSQFSSN